MPGPSQSSQPSHLAHPPRYVATPGATREPALITHRAKFKWNFRDYENCQENPA